MSAEQIIVAATLAVIAYLYLGYRIRRHVQPTRLKVAEAGELLLADSTVPASAKTSVRLVLDSSFSLGTAIFMLAWLPVVALRPRPASVPSDLLVHADPEVRERYSFVLLQGFRCIAANSPLTFLIYHIERALYRLLARRPDGAALLSEAPTAADVWRRTGIFQH